MAHVTLIEADQAPLAARPLYASGDPGPLVKSLAHVPEVLAVALPFIGNQMGESALSLRFKELVILRASALMKCDYCIKTHTVKALGAGFTRAEVVALREPGPADRSFSDAREAAIVRWADAVAAGPGPVAASAVADIKQHVSEAELVELTLVISTTILLNRYCTALDLPVAPAALRRLEAEGLL